MCENLLCCSHVLSTIKQFSDVKTHGSELCGQGKQQWLPSFLHARLSHGWGNHPGKSGHGLTKILTIHTS